MLSITVETMASQSIKITLVSKIEIYTAPVKQETEVA